MKTSGNTILITGGTSGIGLAFAKKFLELNNRVIICGRREDRLKKIKESYNEIETRVCDVQLNEDRITLASWVLKNFPDTNILINNAGIQLLADLTKEVDLGRIYQEVEINLIAPIHLSSLFVQHFKQKNETAIINISSGLAFTPLAVVPIYCSTKAAIHSLTFSLRHQLKDTSIKVFEIAPPSVDTELGADRRADKLATHGGMHVDEFIAEAMQYLENDVYESAVGPAKNMREKRDAFFPMMNH
jgi:uncharacterized oxidoreductase